MSQSENKDEQGSTPASFSRPFFRRTTSKGLIGLAAFLVVSLLLTACGSGSASTGTSPKPTVEGQATARVTTAVTPKALTPQATPQTNTKTAANQVPATTVAEAAGLDNGLASSGDEPTKTYTDPGGLFSFQYPGSWGNTTQNGETIRFTGRDEYISISITDTAQPPLTFAQSDLPSLTKVSPSFASTAAPQNYTVAGQTGAMVAFNWQAGPSQVTNKLVPSSANRYYIPGSAGKMAIYTYSSPVTTYDPAGADDFANAFHWLK